MGPSTNGGFALPKVGLGRTGVTVTKLAFGALELRDVREAGGRLPSEERAGAVLNAVQAGAGTIIRGGATKGAPLREEGRGNEFPIVRDRWVRSGLSDLLAGLDPVATMLRYAIGHPSAHTFIVGTQDLDHLRANLEAVEKGPLDPALHAAIRERVEAVVG